MARLGTPVTPASPERLIGRWPRIEMSSYPNWTGEEQIRQVELTDRELILRTMPIRVAIGEIVSELRWTRGPST
jgi:hypothetical protein